MSFFHIYIMILCTSAGIKISKSFQLASPIKERCFTNTPCVRVQQQRVKHKHTEPFFISSSNASTKKTMMSFSSSHNNFRSFKNKQKQCSMKGNNMMTTKNATDDSTMLVDDFVKEDKLKLLIQWSSLSAVMDDNDNTIKHAIPNIQFKDATVPSTEKTNDPLIQHIITEHIDEHSENNNIPIEMYAKATRRSCLVRNLFEIIAIGDTYEEFGKDQRIHKAFSDMMVGGVNENASWRLKISNSTSHPESMHHGIYKSFGNERAVTEEMGPLFIKFGGKVDLDNPDYVIYALEGLLGNKKVLARLIAEGIQTSSFAPTTRICITNTPLCPIAAFSLSNIGQIKNGHTVLDPYAGSCALLLACAKLAPQCKTVGIEIAANRFVNFDDIRKDFDTRDLNQPIGLIRGDFRNREIRNGARSQIIGTTGETNHDGFDLIITDPPYGVREATDPSWMRENGIRDDMTPINQIISAIIEDREAGTPLLSTKDGRLVVFIPVFEENDIYDEIPNSEYLIKAGLRLSAVREQPLNSNLSRWMVLFTSI